jgi:3'-phosphoadenosine 5'-phosphosulfate sulfotransferase (PAPS reductase)/FAD synthetase
MLQTLLALDGPDLASYDLILLAFSGGKDSWASLLLLLELGVPPSKIHLHHHDVDGGWAFMDWPITGSYCRAAARAFGIDIVFSWREGGFLAEMTRDATPTAPITWESEDGGRVTRGGKGPPGTRQKFPQVSADLSVRWCSAYLKIDVMDAVIRNDPRYRGKRLLVITGERVEPHRAHLPPTKRTSGRHIDHWRPVHRWTRDEVWDIIRRHGVVAHPGYWLGWGRLSCMKCIFGSANQWAAIDSIDPHGLARIASYERRFGKTIHRTRSVEAQAHRGEPYPAVLANKAMVDLAMPHAWGDRPIRIAPEAWTMPAGATGEDVGPT